MAVAGSSFLSVMDRLAFEILTEGTITVGNISKMSFHSSCPYLISMKQEITSVL